MPAFSTITLADGQSTPANHTFTPVSLSEGLAVWNDRAKSVQLEQPYITAKTTRGRSQAAMTRQTFTLNVPSFNSVEGKLVNTVGARIEILLPGNSSQAQRDDIAAYVKNFASSSTFSAMVKNMEGVFA